MCACVCVWNTNEKAEQLYIQFQSLQILMQELSYYNCSGFDHKASEVPLINIFLLTVNHICSVTPQTAISTLFVSLFACLFPQPAAVQCFVTLIFLDV